MTRVYRFLVTVTIEGDIDTAPDILEVAEHIATQVQDADDHDFSTCVRPIETQDFPGDDTTIPLTRSHQL
jgi:hypothetical protein